MIPSHVKVRREPYHPVNVASKIAPITDSYQKQTQQEGVYRTQGKILEEVT